MEKGLAVITVNYQRYDLLEDFIQFFENQTSKDFKIFISDLSDNKESIRKREFTEVMLGENKGYAHGINMGLKKALEEGFDKFVVVNNDTLISNDFVQKTIEGLKRNPGSLIGAKIYYARGFEYHKERYKKEDLGRVIWYAGGEVDWNHAFTKHRGVDEVDGGQFDRLGEAGFITGCFMGFDKEAFNRIGLWDEHYFLFFEDADYCERAKRKGIRLYFDPSIVIWHKVSQSTGGSGSPTHMMYQEKNRLKFGLKYAPLKTKFHLLKNFALKRLTIR